MPRVLALSLATVILAILLATPHIGTQAQDEVEVKIRWVTYINPTDGRDEAYGTCVFGDYIAVLGQAESKNPYVVLLRKSNGSVVREWIGSETGALYNCISIGGKLYAFGYSYVDYNYYGLIYVFGVNLRILAKIMSENPSGYYSLAYDGKALYIGGWTYEDVNGDGGKEWVGLVEKRALDESLSLVSSKKIYFGSWREGWIYDIGVDPSTGRIWAVGWYKDFDDKIHSLIVVFDSDLRELKVIDYPRGSRGYLGNLYGIAFDGRGYAYIFGDIGVAKFSADGELVAIDKDDRRRDKIVYDNNYLYTFGEDYIRYHWRHVLYIHDANVNVVIKRYVLSENVNARSDFHIGRPALEGNSIYVAGYDEALGGWNTRVVVYSLSIEGVTATATTTITTTPTAATTITTTVTVTVPTTTTVTTTATAATTVTTTTTRTTTTITTTTVTTTVPTTTTMTTTVPTTIPTTTTVTTTVPTAATTITTTVTTTVPTTTTTTTTRTATTTVTTTVPTTTTVTTAVPTTTTVTATVPVTRNVTVTTTATTTVTRVDTATVSVPTTVTITTTTPITTTATAYTTILATTTIPISIPVLSIVTELLERTATVERVVERSITVEKPVTATQTLTKAETTIVDRMTTPTIIALVAAGTLLAITTLILRR